MTGSKVGQREVGGIGIGAWASIRTRDAQRYVDYE